jgi:TolB-like protein/Tfp pilus assembly protein PilF
MSDEGAGPTIFLSYAHGDQAQAQRLTAALQRLGYTVWWDAMIEGGTRYAKSIDEALAAAAAVIVLWSRNSVDSDWVRDEAAQGRDRHRLVPLSLDGTQPPLGFRQIQVIDLSGWRGRADSPQMAAVQRAIDAATGQKVQASLATLPKVTRRRAMAATAAAAAAAAGASVIAWRSGLFGGEDAKGRSIAVLPFRNLNGDPAQAYLSEGMTEEIRSALSRNTGLQVLAATSSNSAADLKGDAVAIASKLGVAYLLEGSIQRVGDIVGVSTNLTNGRTGFSLWSQRVERPLDNIFAFQSEVARTVSNAMSVRMAIDEPMPGGTRNVRAYEAYLRGKSLYNLAKDEATDREARANFELAIAADPDFALAHAGLSRTLASLAASNADASELKPLYAAAVAEAQRAVALAPTLAEGHLALGYARFAGQLDVRGARQSYDEAYRYGRGKADILLLYAFYKARTRQFDAAKAAIARAVVLDPLNPRSYRAAGLINFASRDYDSAITYSRRALELNPAISNAHAQLGNSLMAKGRLDEARKAFAAEKSKMFRLTGLAVLEHRAGNAAAAQRAFDSLATEVGDAALYQQAEVMAQWGQADRAMALLAKARTVGDSGLTAIATDPLLDPIARDPRFVRLVGELGFG